MTGSSIGESTVLRRSFGPIGMSSTDCRSRHFRAFSLIPNCRARLATEASLRLQRSGKTSVTCILAGPFQFIPICIEQLKGE